jgi:type I restriction enzyme R subunit
MTDYDLYDVLGELGYGLSPRTCVERAEAFGYRNANWLQSLPPATSKTLRELAEQFAQGGTEALENPHVFEMSQVRGAGGLAALRVIGNPAQVLRETKERIFAA